MAAGEFVDLGFLQDGNQWWDKVTDTSTGGEYDLMSTLNVFPEFAALPIEDKIEAVQTIRQLPPEQQTQAIAAINAAVEKVQTPQTETTPTTTDTETTSTSSKVDALFDKYYNRKPTEAERKEWGDRIDRGENVEMLIRQTPEAATQGWTPSYGSDIQGTKLPTVPTLSDIKMPDMPEFINYGEDVNGRGPLTYGADIGGTQLADYGDAVGGYTPVKFGQDTGGVSLRQYGDEVGGYSPVKYGEDIAGKKLVTYGDELLGQKPVNYGDTIDGISLKKYGDTIAGYSPVNYDEIVTNPMNEWQYTETPAFKAKNEKAQEELQNRMAARGTLRGQTAANAGAALTRDLFAQDYDKERALFLQNAINRYQAKGADYKTAYQAALGEYNNIYGARTDAYAKAYTALSNEYDKAYTQSLGQYESALGNNQSLYGKAYTAGINEYNTAYGANQDLYNTQYEQGQKEYTAGLTSANTNAATKYGLEGERYNQNLNNLVNQYNILKARYDQLYANQTTEGQNAYKQILDAASLGQGATQGTVNSTTQMGNTVNQATQTNATTAGNAAITGGQTNASIYSGIGNVIPNIMSQIQSLKNYDWGSSGSGNGSSGFTVPEFKVDWSANPVDFSTMGGGGGGGASSFTPA